MNDYTKIVGVAPVEFTTDDGKAISGKTIYYTEPLEPEHGQGSFAGKLFLSSARLAALDYAPAVGQEVELLYDRKGKVKAVNVVDDGVL